MNNEMNYWIIPGIIKYVLSPEQIIKKVSEFSKIREKDIIGKKRFKNIIEARHVCIYLIRLKFDLQIEKIGKIINCDHSTVVYACKHVDEMLEYNKDFSKKWSGFIKKIITDEDKKIGNTDYWHIRYELMKEKLLTKLQ